MIDSWAFSHLKQRWAKKDVNEIINLSFLHEFGYW